MPGAVPRTSSFALTKATLPYAIAIADKGLRKAIQEDLTLKRGVNSFMGLLTNKEVATSQNREYVDMYKVFTHSIETIP